MNVLGRLGIVKATNGGTDTILYSQHATTGEVDYYQTSQTLACVAQVLSSICFGKATRI